MTILERVENVRRLWTLLLPDIPTPSESWLAKWCAAFSDPAIESALPRTSRRFRDLAIVDSYVAVHRYCSATRRHRAEQLRTV